MNIFCPSSHLILSASRCPQCGWERPAAGALGQPAWSQPTGAGLGGPGRHVFAQPAAAQGVIALPLNNREIIGLTISDGRERWRLSLPPGLVTRALIADGARLLLTLSDERPIGLAGPGQLASIDPITGALTTLWQADGHQLTVPALTAQHLFLRTSASGLVAFKRAPRLEVAWRVPLNTFWPLPLHTVGGQVLACDGLAMQGEGWLKALSENKGGELAWSLPTEGMLAQPLTSSGSLLIFVNGKKRIVARDAATGQECWNIPLERIYAPPVAGGGQVFVVARGAAPKNSPGYYLLLALDAATGQERWQAPLVERAQIPPLWQAGQVYLASDEGLLSAFNDQTGAELFSVRLGSEEDPIRTELLVADGLLFAGTYAGAVTALWVEQPPEQAEDPQSALARGDYAAAAAGLALAGDYRQAAGLFAQKIKNIPKALALYEQGKLYREAADLCAEQDLLLEAERFYERAGDVLRQAEMLLLRGDELGAARLFEQANEFVRAAPLYEQAGEFSRARELYEHLGNHAEAVRVTRKLKPSGQQVELLLKSGEVAEAAEAAFAANLLRQAVDLFHKSNLPERELEALHKLKQGEPEEWVFQRIVELARKSGRFVEEAEAWEKLGKVQKTAEAYQRAAMQAEQVPPSNPSLAAQLYEKAATCFGVCGDETREADCGEAIARLRQVPIVQIRGNTAREFKENQWNILELHIHNRGYGPAMDVQWTVQQEHFNVEKETGEWAIRQLAAGATRKVSMHIRPKAGEKGEAVPFAIDWAWKTAQGRGFNERINVSVPVKGEHDSRATSQPVIIQSGAMYVQTEKYVAGDDVSGGQKGDRMEIKRGTTGGLKITADETLSKPAPPAMNKPCPVCKVANEEDAKICIYCGNAL